MSIKDFMNRKEKGSLKRTDREKEEMRSPLCYDRAGNRLYAEDLVDFVERQAEKRRRERLPFELQWRLNANFLSGNQYCDINAHRATVENYEALYDYMSREVFNRIAPIMETRLSHLKRVSYEVAALPLSNDYEDRLKAEIASGLLYRRRRSGDYRSGFERIMGLAELTGSAFVLCWWNTPLLKEEQGDVAFTVLTPYEILPEDLGCEEVGDQPSVIVEQVKSAAEIYDLYGVSIEGGQVNAYAYSTLSGAGGLGYESGTVALTDVKREGVLLRTYMEKPTPAYPQGRMIITAGGRLLYFGSLPYEGYPLCSIKSGRVSGQFFGRSVIENLIPLQRSYNGIKNRINDYVNRSTCGQLLIEEGAVDADDLTERGLCPGAPIVYERGARLPSLLETPSLSDIAYAQCEKLEKDMEYAAGVSGMLAGGSLPSSVSSAVAIEILQNLDTTRLSLYADNMRKGILDLSAVWLSIYRKYVTEEQTLELSGKSKRGASVCFKGEDLVYEELYFESENELQVKEEAQREQYLEALKLGLFHDEEGKLSPLAKAKALRRLLHQSKSDLGLEAEIQLDNARNENAALESGKGVEVCPLDDHALHIAEHRLFALQDRFRGEDARKDCLSAILAHVKAHEQALSEGEKQTVEKKGEECNG